MTSWCNVDLSFIRSCSVRLWLISVQIHKMLLIKTYLKLQHLAANRIMSYYLLCWNRKIPWEEAEYHHCWCPGHVRHQTTTRNAIEYTLSLQWRHNWRDGVSNYQPCDCSTQLFIQKTSKENIRRKHQSSASLAFVRGIHRWLMNSPHKGPITRIFFFHLMTSSWILYVFHEEECKLHHRNYKKQICFYVS